MRDETPAQAAGILERIGDVLLLTGRYDDALASFDAARQRGADAPVLSARMQRKSAAAYLLKSDYAAAADALTDARTALAGARTSKPRRSSSKPVSSRGAAGIIPGARQALSAAVLSATVLAQKDPDAESVLAEGLKQLGNVSFPRGQARGRRAPLPRKPRSCTTVAATPSVSRTSTATSASCTGAWAAGRMRCASSSRACAAGAHGRSVGGIGTTHNNIGEVHRTRGRALGPAIDAYERNRRSRCGGPSATRRASRALTGLGAAISDNGDPGVALRCCGMPRRGEMALGAAPRTCRTSIASSRRRCSASAISMARRRAGERSAMSSRDGRVRAAPGRDDRAFSARSPRHEVTGQVRAAARAQPRDATSRSASPRSCSGLKSRSRSDQVAARGSRARPCRSPGSSAMRMTPASRPARSDFDPVGRPVDRDRAEAPSGASVHVAVALHLGALACDGEPARTTSR